MAESVDYSGLSTEVSFMDWPMCACVRVCAGGDKVLQYF